MVSNHPSSAQMMGMLVSRHEWFKLESKLGEGWVEVGEKVDDLTCACSSLVVGEVFEEGKGQRYKELKVCGGGGGGMGGIWRREGAEVQRRE